MQRSTNNAQTRPLICVLQQKIEEAWNTRGIAGPFFDVGNTSALHNAWMDRRLSSSLGLEKDGGSDVSSYEFLSIRVTPVGGVLHAPLLDRNTRLEEEMDWLVVGQKQRNGDGPNRRFGVGLLVVLIYCGLTAAAQEITQRGDTSAPFSTRATHLLGFANARNNSTGTLSVQGDSLQFQQKGKPGAKVKIALVREVFLGAESKQVGGLPMTLGKAAAPYGGGRVVSLFAHKKYDTLTLEYLDSDGGIHGAIFRLTKGQGELVKNELIAQGVTIDSRQDQSTKESAVEARHEDN